MKKQLTLILSLALLLAAQLLSLSHAAEHGFEAHDHESIKCQLDIYCKQTTDNNVINSTEAILTAYYSTYKLPYLTNITWSQHHYLTTHPRAPPYSS